jgi:transcriptional regulator with XRE-family HTH domain
MVDLKELKVLLIRNNMTQAELAQAMGVAPATLSRKLNKGQLTLNDANAIINVLKIDDPVPIFFASLDNRQLS